MKEIKTDSSNDYKQLSEIPDKPTKDERWKGVLYINLYGILFAVCLLLASFMYKRHPNIQPEQLLIIRSVIATLLCMVIVNKDLKYAMYDGVPRHQAKNLFYRCLAGGIMNTIELSIVKYLTLVF